MHGVSLALVDLVSRFDLRKSARLGRLMVGPLSCLLAICASATPPRSSSAVDISSATQARLSYANIPLAFESVSHGGRIDSFTGAGRGFRLILRQQEMVLESLMPNDAAPGKSPHDSIRLQMVGSNATARPSGLEQLPGHTFHLEGNDPSTWREDAAFARVSYREIYRGVDLLYYGNQNRLEYDFVVAPGSNVDQMRLAITGARQIRLNAAGDLILTTETGEVSLGRPQVYQQLGKTRQSVESSFEVEGASVGFHVGAYDRTLPLIIDPTLNYSTSVGRSVQDTVNAIAVGRDGSTYVTGVAPAMTSADHAEAFVAHIAADGKTLLYMTYLGGNGATDAHGIAVDAAGNAYVAGETKAADFPVLNGLQLTCSLNQSHQCSGDAFIAKLNQDGSLNFATYLGGSDEDAANAIALDSAGDIYIAGSTTSSNFPVFQGVQPSNRGVADAFVAKLSGDGLHVLYATYLGGSGADEALGIAVDSRSSAYITGRTQSPDFPVNRAFQPECREGESHRCQGEAFITKLSPNGSELAYSTYFGGSGGDVGTAIALDALGEVFIAGTTSSEDFPLVKPMQARLKGKSGIFVTKFLADGTRPAYSTYLGGSGDDQATSITADRIGRAFIGGQTDSADFPIQSPIQAECRKNAAGVCSKDAFLAVLNPAGAALQFSTYLGGSGVDQGRGVAVDAKGSVYLGGAATSADFPMVEKAAMEPGASPTRALPFGGLNKQTSAIRSELPLGGLVAKISDLDPQTSCTGSINWTGLAGDNQWTTAKNWSPERVPIISDSVCIGTNFATTTISIGSISTSANQTISSLVSNANISFTNGQLTVTGGSTFVNALSITGGTLTLNGTNGSSIGTTMTLTGGILAGTDTVSINGLLTWGNDGQMCTTAACNVSGTGVTNTKGGITYTNGNVFLNGRTLNNAGVATWGTTAGFSFFLSYAAVVNNTGTWNYTGDFPILNTGTGGGTFNNAGTFEKTGGTGTTTVNAGFTNTGKVLGQSGTLTFGNLLGTSSGSWSAASGDALVLGGGTPVPSISGNISGAGNVFFSSGTVNIIAGATFTGTGALNINGGTVVFQTGSTVAISQAVALTNGGILAGTDTVSINGLLTWGNDGQMCTTAACNVSGTGVTNTKGGITYTNGNVFLNGRTLNNAGVATWGTTAGFSFFLSYAAVVNNTGTWNYTGDFPILNTGTGGGTFNNAGTFEKTGGTGTTTVNAGFTNTGKVLGQSGTLTFGNLLGTSSGSWSAASGDALVLGGGTPVPSISGNISGAGNVFFSSGTVNIIAGATFTGTGALNINGGTVVFQTGSTVAISQAVALTNGGILAGTDTVSINGLLTWGNDGQMCTTAACNVSGTGVTNTKGGITYTNGNVFLNGRTLNNAGVATWGTTAGFSFFLSYAAVVNNTGTWNYTGDFPILNTGTGGGTFNNAGTFEKTGGTGTTTVNAGFTNTGKVLGQSGTLTFGNLLGTSSGSWSAASGDALVLGGGTPVPSISGNISGAGNVFFSSGTVNIIAGATFTGTGALNINGGTVVFQTGSTVAISQAVALTNGGILAGTDTVSINGLLTWGNDGQMCTTAACNVSGTGVTNTKGGITYTNGNVFLNGRTLNNAGVATWGTTAGFSFFLSYAAVVNNTGTWNYTGDFPILNTGTGGGTFNNAGTFEKTGGTGTTTVNAGFTNTGKVLGQSGTLTFGNLLGTSSGSWSAASGDALVLGGGTPVPSISGNISGAGNVFFSSGTVNIIAGATFTGTGALNINGGTVVFQTGSTVAISQAVALTNGGILAGTDTVSINGLLTWGNDGQMCTTAACNVSGTGVTNTKGGITYTNGNVFLNGRTLNNAGVATWGTTAGFSFFLSYAAVVNNTGTWNYTGDFPILNTGTGGGTFNNAGTFEKTGGTGTTTVNAGFTNTGKVLGQSGTLTFGNLLGTSSGSWSAASGDALVLGGGTPVPSISGNISGAGNVFFSSGTVNIIAGATFTGTGALNINGGTVVFQTGSTVAISQAVALTNGGILAGTDTVSINGLLTWGNDGQMCTTAACNVSGTGVTNTKGGITYTNGNVFLNGRTLNNAGVATWGTTAGFSFFLSYAAVVNNTGTWNYTGDFPILNTGTGGGTFNNAGTFEKTGGTGTTTVNAGYNQTAGTTFLGSGNLAFGSGPNVRGGSITGSGTISGNYAGSVSTNPAGIIAPGTTSTTGSIALTGSGSGNYTEGTGSFNVKIGGTAPGQFDQLTATGTATLGGTLNVFVTNGYNPNKNDSFIILTAGAVIGKFAKLNIPRGWTVTYTSTSVVLNAVPGTRTLISIAVTPNGATIAKGQTQQFVATGTYSDGSTGNVSSSVTWTSATPLVATINATGLATGVSAGTSNITANLNGITSSTAVLTITAVKLLSIAVTPTTATVAKGQTVQFTATGTYSDGSTGNITSSVTWTSATPLVATINATGLATGVSAGTSNITANLNGITSSTAVLTITAVKLLSIAVTPTTATVAKGQTVQFTATGTYSDGSTGNITSRVTWTSATPLVATINANGLAAGLSAGTSNITANLNGITSSTAALMVTAVKLLSIAVTPTTATVAKGQTQQFTATGTYSDGSTGNITNSVTWTSAAALVATINANGLASAVSAGTSNITANLNGITSPPGVLTVTAAKLLSIAVTPISATIAKGQTQQFTATGTYSDGSTGNLTSSVTWTSTAPLVATINATGLATGVSAGTSNITANLNGITSPPGVLTVTAAKLLSIAVTPISATIAKGQTQQFTATGTYSDGSTGNLTSSVTWTSTAPLVATINATGLATGVSAGTSTITANLNGITSSTAVLTVTAAKLLSIAVTPSSATIAKGQTHQFTATGTYSDGSTGNITSSVTWTSATSLVATINANGLAAGLSAGTSNITADLSGVTSPAAVLTVTAAKLLSIAVTPISATIAKGQTQQFTATGTYSDGSTGNLTSSVTWTSTAPLVATINATGLATGVSAGTSTITANLNGITSSTAALMVTAVKLLSIAVTPTTATVAKGQTQQFTATGTYSDGSTGNITNSVTWTSAAALVATINANGLASAVSAGTSNITANLNGITSPPGVLTVTAAKLLSIAVTPISATIAKGQTQQFTATGTYSDGSTGNLTSSVTWTSTAPLVATINATGLATGVSAGTSTITANLNGITSSTAVLTVTAVRLLSIGVSPSTATIAKGQTQQFTATGTYSDGSTGNLTSSVTWTSATLLVATINGNGLATALSAGTSNITANLSGITSSTALLTITAAKLLSIAVTPSTATIAKGQTQQFTATGTYSDGSTSNLTSSVTWTSATPLVATINANGLATALSAGTSNITANLNGITSPAAVLTVTAAKLLSIAVTPLSATIAKGQTHQFTATGTYSDGSTGNITSSVTWTSATPLVATINANGLAAGLSAGTSNITADLSGVTSPAAVLTVTEQAGEPIITIKLLDQSASGEPLYVDIQATNTGSGPATNVSLYQIRCRTLAGSGSVNYNAAVPIALGSLKVGESTTVRLHLNETGGVNRFSIAENGSLKDSTGTDFSFASSQLVIY